MYGFEAAEGFVFYKYRDFDGTVSLTEGHLKWFWDVMQCAGQIPVIFYDGSVECFEDFKNLVEKKEQHFFLGFKDDKPSGLFWLNGFAQRSCFVHLAIMPDFFGKETLLMGKGVLRHLLTVCDVSGGYILDCVKGLIPVMNPLACRMAERSGFSKVGILPQAAYWAAEDKSVDAAIFCAVRNS
ncbi:GNAT family N-acetyltransferase [Maridesulfovibrio ferrireducens]|uniref:GNAT family N-acetyltransferase n=1 Tax=Maridesulfovibrio ferrireducens TaxID=246191 RepID=UPI001A1F7FA4|nr:GNAT family N-acetyltransferase [Maridesulfovibrio ferrireducens]MBI9112812.1 GNAT family N-acetyltransferase [Maridesulfovibrio ferrireducens]